MVRLALLAACLGGATGCVGTMFTRFHNPGGDWAGKYPFQAFAFDVGAMASDWHGGHAGIGVAIPLLAVFSWPWDLAFDTLLLPVDAVAWVAGGSKTYEAPPSPPPPPDPWEAELAAGKTAREPARFDGWAAQKPGAWVRFRTTVEQPGLKVEVSSTHTLLEIDGDRRLIEHKTEIAGSRGGTSLETRREWIRRGRDVDPLRIEEEGDEDLVVAGRTLACHWIRGARDGAPGQSVILWLSPELPGGVAKIRVLGGAPERRAGAVAWQSK